MAKNKFTSIILVLTVIASVTVCAMASEEVHVKSSSTSSEKKENIQLASLENLKSPSLEPENPKSPSLSEKENQKSQSSEKECDASEHGKSAWKNTKSSSKHEKAAAPSSSKPKSKLSAMMYDDKTLRNMNDEEAKEWAMRVAEEHKNDVLTEEQKATVEKLKKMNDEQLKEWVDSVLKSEKPKDEVHNSIRGNLFQSGDPFQSNDPFRTHNSIESEFCIAGCMSKMGSLGCTAAWNCAGISRKACAAICPS